jgi:hypothetical protein
MGRWPDDNRPQFITMLLIFFLLPALCYLAWWFLKG